MRMSLDQCAAGVVSRRRTIDRVIAHSGSGPSPDNILIAIALVPQRVGVVPEITSGC
jgi:hypothetical protein